MECRTAALLRACISVGVQTLPRRNHPTCAVRASHVLGGLKDAVGQAEGRSRRNSHWCSASSIKCLTSVSRSAALRGRLCRPGWGQPDPGLLRPGDLHLQLVCPGSRHLDPVGGRAQHPDGHAVLQRPGRSRSRAQRVTCRLVTSPRSSARSSSGAPTISAFELDDRADLGAHAPWRVASSVLVIP